MSNLDVLFLSVSIGAGHLKAAEAIKEVIEEKHPGSRTLIVDTLKYANPVINKLVVGSYLSAVKKTPMIYGKLYELSESGDNIYDFSKNVNKILSYRMLSLINEFKPSVVVCTHPFPLQMLSILKKKNRVTVPVVGVLTDFVTHLFWMHESIDAYIVAHDYMKRDMVAKGFREDSIYPYGIPVSSDFLENRSKEQILKEMGLEQKLTILMMGGSLGVGEVKETFKSLLEIEKDFQIIIIAGKNAKLRWQLEKLAAAAKKTVKILSFTNRVPDLMEISDFIITKPGGMTVSESLVKELPILVMSPIPGQEEGNANFLINSGVAARVPVNGDMKSVFYEVIDNPVRVRHMKEIARYLAKPGSSRNIVEMLESLVGKQPCI